VAWAIAVAGSRRTQTSVRHFNAVRILSVFPSKKIDKDLGAVPLTAQSNSHARIGSVVYKRLAQYLCAGKKVKASMEKV
jgi:hypothetical protein